MGILNQLSPCPEKQEVRDQYKVAEPFSPQALSLFVVGCEIEHGQPREGTQEAVGGGGPQGEMSPSGKQMVHEV